MVCTVWVFTRNGLPLVSRTVPMAEAVGMAQQLMTVSGGAYYKGFDEEGEVVLSTEPPKP